MSRAVRGRPRAGRSPSDQWLGRLLVGWAACGALLVLAVPLGQRLGAGVTAGRFLAEFLTDGQRPWLTAVSRPPVREAVTLAGNAGADAWRVPGRPPYPPLVLVHGLTPDGKDDARLQRAARLLARAGFRVLVPDLPGLHAQHLRPSDATVVAAALTAAAAGSETGRTGAVVLAVSVGIQPALAGAARVPGAVRLVVSLGGYAEARELVRYFTTGAWALGDTAGRARLDPDLARAFLASNLDLVRDADDREAVRRALAGAPLPATAGAEARAVLAVLENRDPDRVDTLLAALPAETRALLDILSPARDVGRLPARLLLVHGGDDPAIPFTESRRLAAAADPARTRLVVVSLLAHVEGHPPASVARARDFFLLWTVLYELFRG
jgi:pimeloyl-ACP methyl ester carboxylesterase